jgi:hypothetical protein
MWGGYVKLAPRAQNLSHGQSIDLQILKPDLQIIANYLQNFGTGPKSIGQCGGAT